MKKKILFSVLLGTFLNSAHAFFIPEFPSPMEGHWFCEHDEIPYSPSLIYEAAEFMADSFKRGDGSFIFKAIEGGSYSFSENERAEYGGEVYATWDGNDKNKSWEGNKNIEIEIPSSPFADHATATISSRIESSYVTYTIEGVVEAEVFGTEVNEVTLPDGRIVNKPRQVKKIMPVDFNCSRKVLLHNRDVL